MDPMTILAAFAPIFVDAGKAAVQRWLAPDEFKPTNVSDYLQMREQDLRMFEAMNNAGGTNESYRWVEAVVRLMRPSIAILVIGTWASMKLQGISSDAVDNFAGAIGFYLFADRTLFYARKGNK